MRHIPVEVVLNLCRATGLIKTSKAMKCNQSRKACVWMGIREVERSRAKRRLKPAVSGAPILRRSVVFLLRVKIKPEPVVDILQPSSSVSVARDLCSYNCTILESSSFRLQARRHSAGSLTSQRTAGTTSTRNSTTPVEFRSLYPPNDVEREKRRLMTEALPATLDNGDVVPLSGKVGLLKRRARSIWLHIIGRRRAGSTS